VRLGRRAGAPARRPRRGHCRTDRAVPGRLACPSADRPAPRCPRRYGRRMRFVLNEIIDKDFGSGSDLIRASSQWSEAPFIPITIYLSEERGHQHVRHAVENMAAGSGLRINSGDDPVIGSWFRRIRAVALPGRLKDPGPAFAALQEAGIQVPEPPHQSVATRLGDRAAMLEGDLCPVPLVMRGEVVRQSLRPCSYQGGPPSWQCPGTASGDHEPCRPHSATSATVSA
jgi:hypothetical protein